MKRFALLTLFVLLTASPALAQTNLDATYTLDTGTSINYPAAWNAELQDSFVILSPDEFSRAIILDYPIVGQIITPNQTLSDAVSAVADEIFAGEYDEERITTFTILEREAARYDIEETATTAPGSIVAVRFSNERIGMLIAINIDTNILEPMLASFDNTSPANDEAVVPTRGATEASTVPDTYFFQAEGRFIIPAGWSYTPRVLNTTIEYVTLQADDNSTTAIIIELSNVVTDSAALDTVIAASGINLQEQFGITFSTGEFVRSDNRMAYRYNITVNGQAGAMTAVHFDEGGTGLFIAYGDTATYTHDLNMMLGSFTNLEALLDYIQ
jgi:hypothetical protein